MRRGGWLAGVASLCALALASSVRFLVSAQAEELRAAPAFVEPELPPAGDDAPPVAAGERSEAPASAARPASNDVSPTALSAGGAPLRSSDAETASPPTRTDPEAVVAADLLSGATPSDIAAAIEALPEADSGKSPIEGMPSRAATRDALERFYLTRGDMPIFTEAKGVSAAGRAVIGRLNRAGEDGLDLSNFVLPDPNVAIERPADLAEAELTIAEAIVAYAFQASGGRINPARISPLITAKAQILDAERALETVAAAEDKDAALVAFNPPQKGYRELREKLAELRAAYPEASANLRRRPRKGPDGENKSGAALIQPNFDRAGAEAARGQPTRVATAAVGLARLDPGLAQALAGRGPRALEADLLANMEMWRWEPRNMGEERIEVNVADFTLRLLKGDEMLHSARVVVGKPDTQTPVFSNTMRYIVINPSWSVPPSIVRKEMLPKLAEDPDYLTRMGYEVTWHGDKISVKQPPGEKNALGRLAFMFPNEHSVYLHDTPSRSLFGAARRAFSHGCVRVDQPIKLAELVMGGAWSEQRFRALIGGAERTVFLPHPLPIHIEYFTAFVDEEGELQLREDLYGHMRRVESALGLGS